jgi:hypothetical protein
VCPDGPEQGQRQQHAKDQCFHAFTFVEPSPIKTAPDRKTVQGLFTVFTL